MRRFLRRAVKATVLGLLLWGVWIGVWRAFWRALGLPTVRRIEVVGDRMTDPEEVVRRCGVDMGARLYRMDIKEVVRRVKDIPWVRDVQVHRRLPGKLVIALEERNPVALVAAGKLFLVDREGVALPLPGAPPDLPLITGVPEESIKIGRRIVYPPVERALRWICGVEDVDPGLLDEVSELRLGKDGLRAYLMDGTEVRLGDRPEADALSLRAVLHRLSWEGRRARYLDLRFAGQVVARL
ncbi:MAG TPA: FtsQ-type POTRA domain-containing protein [Candidatus Latescibacteria bacterium]|nr:FtsQ-type POTRA domain-containing protein [Candidatus Latescibacterota bacterium]